MTDFVKTFDARLGTSSDLDPGLLGGVIAAASDIALILDAQGVVCDLAITAHDPGLDEARAWLGQEWSRTVTTESKAKVRELLAEAGQHGVSRRRQVNHPSAHGADLPIAYTVLRLGRDGRAVALGRDLRALSSLQQRLVEAQQAMERDYWRMRHIETRYRLLFQLSSEAVLVVDAASHKVVDANPAVGRLLALPPKRLVGRTFPIDLDEPSTSEVEDLLAGVRSSGRSEELRVRTAGGLELALGASLVRQDGASLFLVRMMPVADGGLGGSGVDGPTRLGAIVDVVPDGVVTLDLEGRILFANRGFLDLAQLAAEDQVRGQPLSRWLGRPGADVGVLLATLREHGVARLFSTTVRGEYGSSAEVELSAAVTRDAGEPMVAIVMRDVGRRLASGPQGARDLTRAVEQLTSLVGRVSLRDLVRDTADLVERHFIEAALELTEQNRTSAAEVLGVSRQSLYVKLRRYNLGGDGPRGDGAGSAQANPDDTER
ncbi:MAG TPA: transcriptional regulator PpsR [Gemmatimonadales bacterium]|nr:transcriptional regulator PpsR [Gemmatimonadales bacterium]